MARIVSPGEVGHTPHVAVGASAALAANVSASELSSLGSDDFYCRSSSSVLVLSGGIGPDATRGTLNACFEWLRSLGYRNWAPDGFAPIVPLLTAANVLHPPPSFRCAATGTVHRPSIAIRNVNAFSTGPEHKDLESSQFAIANHLNAVMQKSSALNASYGGSAYYAGGFVGTSFALVPPCNDSSFKKGVGCAANDSTSLNVTHPEWFGEGQLCWMNLSMRAYLINRVREVLKVDPSARIISVSQNDGDGHCVRPEDQAVIEEENSPAAPMLRAINAIAGNISADYPKVIVSTLAYLYTRPAPTITRPRPNVAIRICDISADFGRPLSAPSNAQFRQDLHAWRNITTDGQLHAWSYSANFDTFMVPFPNWRATGKNVQFFAAHGVSSVFMEATQTYPTVGMDELRSWVQASMMWDASRDPDALVDEFILGYYGSTAAPYVQSYMSVLGNATTGIHVGCGCNWGVGKPHTPGSTYHWLLPRDCYLLPWLSDFAVLNAAQALTTALCLIGGKEPYATRVDRVLLSIRWVMLNRWQSLCKLARIQLPRLRWPLKPSMSDEVKDLVSSLARHGITWLGSPRVNPGWNRSSLLVSFNTTFTCA